MLPLIPLAIELLPSIAKWAFGDKAEATATAVAQVVSAVTGKSDPAEAEAMIRGDPTVAASLKLELTKLHVANEEDQRATDKAEMLAAMQNVADARARDVALQASGRRNVRADIMLICVTFSLISCVGAVTFATLNPVAATLITSLAGTLSGCFKDAFNFEFGSSRQSENKTQALIDMGNNSVPVAALQNNTGALTGVVTGAWDAITAKVKR